MKAAEPALTLFLTSDCNLSCPYCFASRVVGSAWFGRAGMTLEEVRRAVDFIFQGPPRNWGMVKVAGGEPSLNPEFLAVVRWLVGEGYMPWVLTNGLWHGRTLEGFVQAHGELAGKVQLLVNYNLGLDVGRRRKLDSTVEALVPLYRVCLGVNVFGDDPSCLDIVGRCRDLGVGELRFGIAQPAGGSHAHVAFDDYPAVGRLVAELARRGAEAGLRLAMDCSHPPCLFRGPDAELISGLVRSGALRRHDMNCGAPLVVGPGGRIWRCFHQGDISARKTLDGFRDVREALRWFDRRLDPWDVGLGAGPACAACGDRLSGACPGGCPGFHGPGAVESHLEGAMKTPGDRVFRLRVDHLELVDAGRGILAVRAGGRAVRLKDAPWRAILQKLDGRARLGDVLSGLGVPCEGEMRRTLLRLVRAKVLQVVS